MGKFEKDLSKGSVFWQLILFSLPFLLSNVIQSLYGVADLVIVARFCGTASMSGVNIGSQITFIVTNMVMGLSVGATVLIGQYLGSKNKKAMQDTIGTLFCTLLIASVVLTVLMLVFKDPLLNVIKTPAESFSEASDYFFVTALGTLFIFGYNALSAVMRGMGDSKNPLIFVSIACVVNIALDLVLVAKFNMGAMGAAIATVISQAISMILCIIYLKKNDFIFDFSLSSFRINPEQLKLLLKVGIPTSVQNVASGLSFLFLTTLANSLGVTASAAIGAVGKFNGFAILPAVAMSSSISAMSAQNIGAGEIGRAKKTMYIGMAVAVSISTVIFVLVKMFPTSVLKIFNDDPALLAEGAAYIKYFSLDYIVAPIMFTLNGLFIGAGHTTFSLINGILSSVLIRIPVSYLFGMMMQMGMEGMGIAAPVASGVSLVIGVVYFFSGKWKKMVVVHDAAVIE